MVHNNTYLDTAMSTTAATTTSTAQQEIELEKQLRNLIIDFCDKKFQYELNLKLFGSIHIFADNEKKLLSCLFDENLKKQEQMQQAVQQDATQYLQKHKRKRFQPRGLSTISSNSSNTNSNRNSPSPTTTGSSTVNDQQTKEILNHKLNSIKLNGNSNGRRKAANSNSDIDEDDEDDDSELKDDQGAQQLTDEQQMIMAMMMLQNPAAQVQQPLQQQQQGGTNNSDLEDDNKLVIDDYSSTAAAAANGLVKKKRNKKKHLLDGNGVAPVPTASSSSTSSSSASSTSSAASTASTSSTVSSASSQNKRSKQQNRLSTIPSASPSALQQGQTPKQNSLLNPLLQGQQQQQQQNKLAATLSQLSTNPAVLMMMLNNGQPNDLTNTLLGLTNTSVPGANGLQSLLEDYPNENKIANFTNSPTKYQNKDIKKLNQQLLTAAAAVNPLSPNLKQQQHIYGHLPQSPYLNAKHVNSNQIDLIKLRDLNSAITGTTPGAGTPGSIQNGNSKAKLNGTNGTPGNNILKVKFPPKKLKHLPTPNKQAKYDDEYDQNENADQNIDIEDEDEQMQQDEMMHDEMAGAGGNSDGDGEYNQLNLNSIIQQHNKGQLGANGTPNSNGQNLDYECRACEKKFKYFCYYKRHMDACHSEWPKYVCETCNKSYKWEASFRQHLRSHHANLASQYGANLPTSIGGQGEAGGMVGQMMNQNGEDCDDEEYIDDEQQQPTNQSMKMESENNNNRNANNDHNEEHNDDNNDNNSM